ncbi:MFS transporter [Actinoallomurus soli]|uniref:MFS transporter n=1 Tax=Actinoallomurus soli TaxID=2952535 RepID=UPI0020937A51|nr:MFS transporter [Actinoallomurus soli]MCO5973721.1 MFS transporter [Actinoallomurus soli]
MLTLRSTSESRPRTGALPLVAICLGYFAVIIDATAVNLSLPALGRDLGGGMGVLQWVVDGYTLTFATLLLSAGALGDRVGPHRVFCAGLALFTVASAACGLAPTAGALVAARLVQGAAAAVMVPSSLALLQAAHPDPRARARAVGVWGGVAGVAAASGPVLGGVLTDAASWRLVFFINVPIGLAALLLTVRHVVRPEGHGRRGLDLGAQITVVGALGLLTFALIEARTRGWVSPVVLGALAVAALLAAVFTAVERRTANPMLPLGLFRGAAFSGGNAVGLLINLGFYGQLFVLSLFFQDVRRMSPTLAGLALVPEGILVSLASFLSGRMTGRSGTRTTMLIGLVTGAAGLFALTAAGRSTPYPMLMVPLMAAGFGMAFTMPAATTAVVEAAPPERAGVASGAVNTARQMGSTIGVALLGTLGAGGRLAAPMAGAGAAFLAGALVVAVVVRSRGPEFAQARQGSPK